MTFSFLRTPWIGAALCAVMLQVADCQLPSNETSPPVSMLRKRSKEKWTKESAGSAEILRIAADDDNELTEAISLFVKYKNGRGKSLARKVSRVKSKRLPHHPIMSIETIDREAIRELLDNPNIDFVELNHKVHALQPRERPKKPLAPEEQRRRVNENVGYGMKMVQADQLWDIPRNVSQTGNMTICIIDSGMALGHPDLPMEGVTGTNTGIGDWRVDDYGHGTHCLGTIGALGNNDIGVAGILRNMSGFNFHVAKALDAKGEGSEFLVLKALEGCIAAGSKVISMSIGGDEKSDIARNAFQAAYDEGVLLVAASGNAGDTSYAFPASFPSVMSVAATGQDEAVAPFSQYNDQVELAAPGVDIVSTVPKFGRSEYGYDGWSGTSMATPFVAGIAALLWSHFEECSNHQIRNVLIRTARDISESGCDTESGFGMVQAKEAYDRLKLDGCSAGGESPQPLSNGAIGGCKQDPLYTQPPTPSPTEFLCEDKVFMLNLTTDKWGEETSWVLTNSKNDVIESAYGLRSEKTIITRLCLPVDSYTFTIRDRENDGICCNYGEGRYSVYFDGQLEKDGGNFGPIDKVRFGLKTEELSSPSLAPSGEPATFVPSMSPTLSSATLSTVSDEETTTQVRPGPEDECIDDKFWSFTTKAGVSKPCRYLKSKSESRCQLIGTDALGNDASGYEACPRTCGTCSISDVIETSAPTRTATSVPTTYPTLSPSSRVPTSRPTISATDTPTITGANKAHSTEKVPSECRDDGNWVFTKNGSTKKCKFVAKNPARCKLVGQDEKSNSVSAFDGCPLSCGKCSFTRVSEQTAAPSALTPPPTIHPTSYPTNQPTTIPTKSPTLAPTAPPTLPPTLSPTPVPSKSLTATDSIECQDDKDWVGYFFFIRMDCKSLEAEPSSCGVTGKNAEGFTLSGYEACPVACNTCPATSFPPSTLCNTGYENGILLCEEDESKNECIVFVKLNGDSCDDFCTKQGGYCISARESAGDSCSSKGPTKCSDELKDNICSCSVGDSRERPPPPPAPSSPTKWPSCRSYNGKGFRLCEETEAECRAYVELKGDSCDDYCKSQGGTCTFVESTGDGNTCYHQQSCSNKVGDNICTCSVNKSSCRSHNGKDFLLCDQTETQCVAYVELDGDSCDDFCMFQGGRCISADANGSGVTCTKRSKSCSKGATDNICTCSF